MEIYKMNDKTNQPKNSNTEEFQKDELTDEQIEQVSAGIYESRPHGQGNYYIYPEFNSSHDQN